MKRVLPAALLAASIFAVAFAGAPGQLAREILQAFGGPVNARAATTGQVLTRQSDGSWAGASASSGANPLDQGGRLTLSSTDACPSSDQTGKTTLYFLPYKSTTVATYSGSAWVSLDIGSTGISLAIASFPSSGAANTTYDIFVYSNSGTATLEALAWATSTAGAGARATALTTQNGVLVKTGALTRRYLGTVHLNGSTQLTDSASARDVWNYNHRLSTVTNTAMNSWTETSTSWTAINGGAAAGKHEFVIGVADEDVTGELGAYVVAGSDFAYLGIALNGTSSSELYTNGCGTTGGSTNLRAIYAGRPPIGLNYLQAMARVSGGTITYYGIDTSPNPDACYGGFVSSKKR